MKVWKMCITVCWFVVALTVPAGNSLYAREVVHLTLDTAVDIAMGSSYRIKQ